MQAGFLWTTAIALSFSATLCCASSALAQSSEIGTTLLEIDTVSLRGLGEAAVRARLIDPSSADFEWPYGFVEGTWPTILKNRVFEGYITCGFVNSKNRMGGYAGRSAFVVVVKDGVVSYADVGTPRGSDFTSRSCARSAASLPRATVESFASRETSRGKADELRKLAELRDSGVITQEEFELEKRKLLDQ